MNNKEVLDEYLKVTDSICSEVTNLFHVFLFIANDYIVMTENYNDLLEENDIFISNRTHLDLNVTIDLVYKYLESISKEYAMEFIKLLNDGTFELFLREDDLKERPDDPITTPKPNSTIYIPVENTIEDGAVIVHEFFHYLNDTEELIIEKDIFTEMISIYNELRYYQFINKLGYNNINFYKEVCSRISNSVIAAEDLCYSASILDIYHNTGDITKENIKFIDKFRDIYLENTKELIDYYNSEKFSYDIGHFTIDLSFVMGTILAFYAIKEPKLYDIKMKYINEHINSLSIKEVLSILDTRFEDYQFWIDDTEEMLVKAIGEVSNENNMHSRTYRCRKN